MNYCFVEGETEIKLISEMNSNKLIKLSCTRKYNLWEINISKHLIKIKPNANIYVVFDTDIISSDRKDKFIKNITLLVQNRNKIILLQQTKNLEDELCTCCDFKNKNQLFKLFSSEGSSEFKTKFIANNSVLKILNTSSIKRMWSNNGISNDIKNILPNKYHKHITVGSYSNLSLTK